jgi:uncharacterized protein (DUF2249 family)
MSTSNVQIQTSAEATTAPAGGCGCGGCGCGQAAEPELNLRALPRQIRHGAVLGALASLQPGDTLVLVAPHEPRRLLAQVDATFPELFEVSVAEVSPEEFRARFVRVA